MNRSITRRAALSLAGGALAAPLVLCGGFAQAYPVKPVTVIIPFGAGEISTCHERRRASPNASGGCEGRFYAG